MVRTRGNPDCHIILRGGATPNYDEASVAAACDALGARRPATVADDRLLARQLRQAARAAGRGRGARSRARSAGGSRRIFGAMIESHLHPGAQKFTPGRDDPAKLAYGISITDPCLGWEQTVEALGALGDAVRRRRAGGPAKLRTSG